MAKKWWLAAAAGLYAAGWLWAKRQKRRAEHKYPPEGQFLSLQGVPIHYVRRGTGRTVVLLHGSDGFLQDFNRALLDRIAADYDVIALDRPGHGYSKLPPDEQASAPVQARLIHETLTQLGVKRPLLVGHSWSGLLLLTYAWKYPADIAGLVLLAPWIYPGRTGERLLRVFSTPWIARLIFPLFAPIKPLVVRWFLKDAFDSEPVPADYRKQAEALWLRTPIQLAATARENSGNRTALRGFSPSAVSSNLPIVIGVGDRDRVTPPRCQALRLQAEIPQAKVSIIRGAGHELPHTNPDTVLQLIHDGWGLVEVAKSEALNNTGVMHEPVSRARARALVMRYGWNSAAYQILNPQMELWFTSERDGCVGYVRWAGVRIVAGAPICAEERLASAAEEFEQDARRSGESVCYFGAADRLRAALVALPAHSAVPIGAQPSWRPERWEDILKSHRSLRAQLNRARNKGVTVAEWDRSRASDDPGLQRCFNEWDAGHSGFSLHFLTEPVAFGSLGDRRVFVAEREGVLVGFLVAAPVPERRGWLAEQIVRGSGAPNGTAELLMDGLMRTMAQEQFEFVTLGLAPLSRRGGVTPPRRLWLRLLLSWIRAHGARFYNFEGLDSFKAKFQPDLWEPIYAISNESRFSARTLYGVAAAFTDGAPVIAIGRAVASAVNQEWRLLRHRGPSE